jgi:oligopeptide transport system substrate-binding protein
VTTPRNPRRLLSRRSIALSFAGLLAIALLGTVVHEARTRGPQAPSVILRRGNGPEPESLDLHGARSEAALTILRDLYEGLTEIGTDGTPVLAAADHVDVSADGMTYRFHLRAGARWSNGEPVSAEDFAASWRRLVDPRTAAQYADLLTPIRGAAAILKAGAPSSTLGVRAEDVLTLVVELEHPTPYFLGLLAHPATFPINRASLAARGRAFAKPGVMVSNGAFVLTRWDFGSHLVAVRNPRYWNDQATRITGVEYYSFADAAAELRAFRTGQVDVTVNTPAAQTDWIRQHLADSLHVAPQLAVYYLGLNLRRPPFAASRELRQALSMVIDREQLVRSVTGGGESPAYAFVPPQTHDYTPSVPEYAGWPMARRIATARQLLRDAGLDRHPPVVELRYNSGELHNRIAIAVAQMWKQSLGIDATLRAEEFKVLLQDIDRGDAGVFRASWVADFDDAFSFLQVFKGGFGLNMPRYANAVYDDLLNRAARDPDASSRRELLQSAEAVMLAEQPIIPLYFYVSKHLVAADVQGWSGNPMNVVYSKNLSKDAARAGK